MILGVFRGLRPFPIHPTSERGGAGEASVVEEVVLEVGTAAATLVAGGLTAPGTLLLGVLLDLSGKRWPSLRRCSVTPGLYRGGTPPS